MVGSWGGGMFRRLASLTQRILRNGTHGDQEDASAGLQQPTGRPTGEAGSVLPTYVWPDERSDEGPLPSGREDHSLPRKKEDPLATRGQAELIRHLVSKRDPTLFTHLVQVRLRRLEDGCLTVLEASEVIDALKNIPEFLDHKPATQDQIGFIKKLVSDRNEKHFEPRIIENLTRMQGDGLSVKAASQTISLLQRMPRFRPVIGYHSLEGSVFNVEEEEGGSIKTVVLVLSKKGGSWKPAPKLPCRLDEETRMTLEDAIAFGKATGHCCVCGTKLTNPASIEAGIGPVCAKKLALE